MPITRAVAFRSVAFGALSLLAGCASPLHLTYDFGRAFTQAFVSQADLTRPSISNVTYGLYGIEAAEIRIRVREESTDKESGESKLSNEN